MYLHNLKYRCTCNSAREESVTRPSAFSSPAHKRGFRAVLAQYLDRLVESTADNPPSRCPDDALVIFRRQQDLDITDDRAPLVRLSSQPRPFRLEFAPLLGAQILPFFRKQVFEFFIWSGDPVRAAG